MRLLFAALLFSLAHGRLHGGPDRERELGRGLGPGRGAAKVEVCHIPPGNPMNYHTINVGEAAVPAHLAHGDLLGSCDENCDTLCDDDMDCTDDDCGSRRGCVNTPNDANCDQSGGLCNPQVCSVADGGCVNVPVKCLKGEWCDPLDGKCKPEEELIPCVAVIDEDSSFQWPSNPNQYDQWELFKEEYPDRPFCLLKPVEGCCGTLTPPSNFLSDVANSPNKYKYVQNIRRDGGNDAAKEYWAQLCGLDTPIPGTTVPWVGLFVDISGSMVLADVKASYDQFYDDIEDPPANGEVREVQNPNENWILPFMTDLAPTAAMKTATMQTAAAAKVNKREDDP